MCCFVKDLTGFHLISYLFAKAISRILNKHKNWKSLVIGDEAREEINVEHKKRWGT